MGKSEHFSARLLIFVQLLLGLISCVYGDPSVVQDMMLVDNVAKSLIVAAWQKVLTRLNKHEVVVYNASGDVNWEVSYYTDFCERLAWDVPFTNRLRYCEDVWFFRCWYYYYMCFVFFDLMPGLLLDGLLKISGRKAMLFKLLKRTYIGNMAVSSFINNSWTFKNDHYLELDEKLLECDRPLFAFLRFRLKSVEEIYNATKESIAGAGKFVLNETPTEQTYRNTYRLYLLNRVVKLSFYGWLLYWIFWKCDVISVITSKVYDYFNSLEAWNIDTEYHNAEA